MAPQIFGARSRRFERCTIEGIFIAAWEIEFQDITPDQ
jgi:hypothetical protein